MTGDRCPTCGHPLEGEPPARRVPGPPPRPPCPPTPPCHVTPGIRPGWPTFWWVALHLAPFALLAWAALFTDFIAKLQGRVPP